MRIRYASVFYTHLSWDFSRKKFRCQEAWVTLKISLRRLRFASGDFKIKTFAIIIMFKTYFTQWEKRFEFHALKLDQKWFNFCDQKFWSKSEFLEISTLWKFEFGAHPKWPVELNAKSFEKEINGIYCK